MKLTINYQSNTSVDNQIITSSYSFKKWVRKNSSKSQRIYVVLEGKESRKVHITSNIDDIILLFEIFVSDIIFIQEFEENDYHGALQYLTDLFEARKTNNAEITQIFKN